MSNSEWLESLKPGDNVCISYGVYRDNNRLAVVEKVTKLHVIVNGYKYQKKGGYRAGDTCWHRSSICEPTIERRKAIHRAEWAGRITALNRSSVESLSDSQLERIALILAESSTEEKP